MGCLYESDVVTPQHYPPQLPLCVPLCVDLHAVIQDKVHELIKPHYVPLYSGINILIQPHRHEGSILQVAKYKIDRLHHHLLDFLTTPITHFGVF